MAIQLDTHQIKQLRNQALTSLYFFARAICGFEFMVPHVHGKVAAFLEQPGIRKRVTLPRGFLKTTMCSVAYPLWLAVKNPDIRILLAYKTLPNASKTIDQIRGIVDKNELFRTLFPEVLPTRDCKWSGETATLNRPGVYREGTWEAAGIGTNLTSRHYDVIIEDDLIAPKKDDLTGMEAMPTKDEIEEAIGWHKLSRSLLITPARGTIINVGTRWTKADLIQYIIDNEENCLHFEMSAVENGEAVYPERFPLEELEQIRQEQGSYIFASQYLNKPYDEQRMIFRPEWLSHSWGYDTDPVHTMRKAIVVDPAISKKKDACNSVVTVLGVNAGKLYVLDYVAGKYNPTELMDKMFELAFRWNVIDIYPESVAWQEALVHFFELKCRELGVWLNVTGIKPGHSESKDTRIRGLQPFAERGFLLLAPWMNELRTELRDFPFSKTLDIADTVAYGPRVLDIQWSKAYDDTRKVMEHARSTGTTVQDVLKELHSKNKKSWVRNKLSQIGLV